METITITFSRNELFKNAVNYSYNKTNDISDRHLHIGNEQYDWFNIALDRADAKIKRLIAHIIDNNSMINRLKERIKLSESDPNYFVDELIYDIQITHHFQLYTISDAIEEALISDIYRQWVLLKKTDTYELEHREIISKLKSISLMIESRIVRPYSVN